MKVTIATIIHVHETDERIWVENLLVILRIVQYVVTYVI